MSSRPIKSEEPQQCNAADRNLEVDSDSSRDSKFGASIRDIPSKRHPKLMNASNQFQK
jgi:hypothetical protein